MGDAAGAAQHLAQLNGFVEGLVVPEHVGDGDGIVVCAGGRVYSLNALTSILLLRHLGSKLPVEWWHYDGELSVPQMKRMGGLGITFRLCGGESRTFRKSRGGYQLKAHALLHSSFKRVLLLDADCFVDRPPEFMFDHRMFCRSGSVLWKDYGSWEPDSPFWRIIGEEPRTISQIESGQMLFDRSKTWEALAVADYLNRNHEFYYHHMFGDKDTFLVGLLKTGCPVTMSQYRPLIGDGMFRHRWFDSTFVFYHLIGQKLRRNDKRPLSHRFRHGPRCLQLCAEACEILGM